MENDNIVHLLRAFRHIIPAGQPVRYRVQGPDKPMQFEALRMYVITRMDDLMVLEVRLDGMPDAVYYLDCNDLLDGPRKPLSLHFYT